LGLDELPVRNLGLESDPLDVAVSEGGDLLRLTAFRVVSIESSSVRRRLGKTEPEDVVGRDQLGVSDHRQEAAATLREELANLEQHLLGHLMRV